MPSFSEWAGDRRFKALILAVLILATTSLAAYTYYTVKQARYVYGGPLTISVIGKGEVFAKPDVATFSFSVMADAKDAVTAQEQSANAINKITEFLRDRGIDEKDIRTSGYDLSPKYEYAQAVCAQGIYCPPGRQVLAGYTVNQTITIKVRNTKDAGELISGVGNLGATNVSSLQFTIDDDGILKAQAREKAIVDAKDQANKLAAGLGVRIVRLMNYWEEQPPSYGLGGYGGDAAVAEAQYLKVSPDIPVGENTVTSRVTLVYEVR